MHAAGDYSHHYNTFANIVVSFGGLGIPIIGWLLDKKGYGITLGTINALGVIASAFQAIPSLRFQVCLNRVKSFFVLKIFHPRAAAQSSCIPGCMRAQLLSEKHKWSCSLLSLLLWPVLESLQCTGSNLPLDVPCPGWPATGLRSIGKSTSFDLESLPQTSSLSSAFAASCISRQVHLRADHLCLLPEAPSQQENWIMPCILQKAYTPYLSLP